MSCRSKNGESFIELLVALVILEIVGAAALAAALTVARVNRHAANGAADDAARWHDYRAAESVSGCVDAVLPDSIPLRFLATSDRPPLETLLRCGR